ncbi:MAG: SDR family oxidoreductase [Rickettsiales bacterium]|nr:SDR family oxidoreductase [Rickettsiales bacterium]
MGKNKRLAIITGASRGIGFEIAKLFQENNFDLINLARGECKLNNVKNIKVDLSKIESVNSGCNLIKNEIKEYESICLIHNASVSLRDNFENINQENLDYIFKVNVASQIEINRILLPLFPKNSSVIFIGSTLSEVAVPNSLSYMLTKHSQAAIMKSLTQDLFGKEIHTCLICPGFTDTQMLSEVFPDKNFLDSFVKEKVSFGRLISPKEIAETILFCSKNPIINGSIIHTNLGMRSN